MVRRGSAWRPAVTGAVQFFGPSDAGWPRPGSTDTTNYVFNRVTVLPAAYPRMLMCTAKLTATADDGDARFDHILHAVGESGHMSISAFTCGPTGITTTVATANRLMPAGTTPLVIMQQFERVVGTGRVTVAADFSQPLFSGLRVSGLPRPLTHPALRPHTSSGGAAP